jgi:hypothetical protein
MAKDKIIPNDPHRAELATAIAAAASARKNLETARAAFTNSEAKMNEVYDELEKLRAVEPVTATQDHLAALAAADGAFDIQALGMPGAEMRAKQEKYECDIAAWKHARALAEKAIPDLKLAVEYDDRAVEHAARAVMGKSFDIGKRLDEAELAAASLAEKRIELMYIRSFLLPEDDNDRHPIASFLSRPWLMDEVNENWKRHPVVVAHKAAFEELLRDAEAPVPA